MAVRTTIYIYVSSQHWRLFLTVLTMTLTHHPIDKINDNRVLVSSYLLFVQSTVSIGSYSDLLHMYTISAAIKKSLRSYYISMLSSEFLAEPYHLNISRPQIT